MANSRENTSPPLDQPNQSEPCDIHESTRPLYIPGTNYEVILEATRTDKWINFLKAAYILTKSDTLRNNFLSSPIEFLCARGVADFPLLQRMDGNDQVGLLEILNGMRAEDLLASLLTIGEHVGSSRTFDAAGNAVTVLPVLAAALVRVMVLLTTTVTVNVNACVYVLVNAFVLGCGLSSEDTTGKGLGVAVMKLQLPDSYAASDLHAALTHCGLNNDRQKSLIKYTITSREHAVSVNQLEDRLEVSARRTYRGVHFEVAGTVGPADIIQVSSAVRLKFI